MNPSRTQMRSKSPWFSIFVVASLTFCLSATRVISAEEKDPGVDESSTEVEILGATKHPIPVQMAPQNVTVITRRQIEELNPEDLSELFRLVPGVDVVRKSAGEFDVSALGSHRDYNNRFILFIDGKPMTHPGFGHTWWAQLPIVMESIERIEVVKGPCSAQYGANAFAGVINIVTDHSDPTNHQGRRISTSVGRRDNFANTVRMADWRKDHGFTYTLKYWNTKGPLPILDLDGTVPSGYDKYKNDLEKFMGVFDWEKTWGTTTRLSTRVSMVQGNRDVYDFFGRPYDLGTSHISDTSLLWFVELFHQMTNRKAVWFKAQSNRYKSKFPNNPIGTLTRDPRTTEDDRFMEYELQGRSYLGKAGYVYGVTYRDTVNDGLVTDKSCRTIRTGTAYGQMEYQFDKKNTGFAGLLFYDSSQNGFDYSPKLSILHKVSDKEVFRAGWGRSFRAPEGAAFFVTPFQFAPMTAVVPGVLNNVATNPFLNPFKSILDPVINSSANSSAQFTDSTGNAMNAFTGSDSLKNEILQQVDVGWEKETAKYRLKVDAWHSQASDLVLPETTGSALYLRPTFVSAASVYGNANPILNAFVDNTLASLFALSPNSFKVGHNQKGFVNSSLKQYSTGVTVEAGRTLSSKFRLDGNVTYQDVVLKNFYYRARSETDPQIGTPVNEPPYSPRWKLNLVARYSPTNRDTITLVGNRTSGMFALGQLNHQTGDYIDGYTTLDLAYLHEIGKKKEARLNFAVKNLFNNVHHEFLTMLDWFGQPPPWGGVQFDRTWLVTYSSKF